MVKVFGTSALLLIFLATSAVAYQQCEIICKNPDYQTTSPPTLNPAGNLIRGKAGPKGEKGSSCECDGIEEMRQEIATLKKLQRKPRDCSDIKDSDSSAPSGVYRIFPQHNAASSRLRNFDGFLVNCDMETDGGGWVIFQKRYDGSQDFNRTFEEYVEGFGEFDEEFWLGLDNIHQLTSYGNWSIRLEVGSFNGETAWAEYSDFFIGAGTHFQLNFDVDSYRGTAGDSHIKRSFSWNQGMKFSAYNLDQDLWDGFHCGSKYGGGWWHNRCSYVNFNGNPEGTTINWYEWKKWERLQSSEIKMRRN